MDQNVKEKKEKTERKTQKDVKANIKQFVVKEDREVMKQANVRFYVTVLWGQCC